MTQRELIGILFIVAVGSILHFTYEASGNLMWVGVFSAMNESVWEHLKLAFWPSLIWTLFLRVGSRKDFQNFWVGRSLALVTAPVLITIGFYGYTSALGRHALAFDLLLFVFAIAFGQLLAIFTYRLGKMSKQITVCAIAIIFVEAMLFILFSYVQPDLPIFIDPTTV